MLSAAIALRRRCCGMDSGAARVISIVFDDSLYKSCSQHCGIIVFRSMISYLSFNLLITEIALWFEIITGTRMVQLPATAAIEYVATCCRTRTITRTRTKMKTRTKTKTKTRTKIRTRTKTGTKMKTGTKTKIGMITKTVRGALCPFPPSSIRIRTVWAFCA